MLLKIIAYFVSLFLALIASEQVLVLRMAILGEKKRKYDIISTIIFISQNFIKAIVAVIVSYFTLMLFRIDYNLFMSFLIFIGIGHTEVSVIRKRKFTIKLHIKSIASWLGGLILSTYILIYVL